MRPVGCCFTILLAMAAGALAGEPIPDGGKLRVEGIVAFTEGPAWHASGNVYFTDIVNNRILRRDPKGVLHVYRAPSGKANGLAFDSRGRLHACEGGGEGGNRRVTRTELDGTVTVLADSFDGKRFNSPNDVAISSRGAVYFTDPRYGDRSDLEQIDGEGRAIEGVYRIDKDGALTRIITHEVHRPNGIAFSPDERFLYVADNVNDGPNNGLGGNRKLWRFAHREDGSVDLDSRQLLYDWGTDRGQTGWRLTPKGVCLSQPGSTSPSRRWKRASSIGRAFMSFRLPASCCKRCPCLQI